MNTFDYIKHSFFFFRQNIKTIAAIQVPFLVLLNGFMIWMEMNTESTDSMDDIRTQMAYSSLISLTLLPIYWGATILFIQSKLDDRPLSAFQALYASLSSWRTLLLVFLVSGMAIFGGLMLFIIPGIYIGIRLAFADYICVIEKRGIMDSLKQSWADTTDYFWTLFQGLIILYPVIQVLEWSFVSYFAKMEERSLLMELPIFVAVDLLSVITIIFGFRIYTLMRSEIRPEQPRNKPIEDNPDQNSDQ